MPRCFMPKKQKTRPALTERTAGRRSPSPCVDLPPPPPPPPLAPETSDQTSRSNVYRPPTPVNQTGKCRSERTRSVSFSLSINVSVLEFRTYNAPSHFDRFESIWPAVRSSYNIVPDRNLYFGWFPFFPSLIPFFLRGKGSPELYLVAIVSTFTKYFHASDCRHHQGARETKQVSLF